VITRATIVARSKQHLGHREVTSNRSPLIDEWIRRCGLAPEKAYAWCAAFASWCVDQYLERKLGTARDVKQAGALNLGRMFPETRTPQPGDVCYFATDAKGAGHVGIVEAGDELHVLVNEGNSDNKVQAVRRLRSEVKFGSTRVEVLALPPIPADCKAPLKRVSYAGTR
jgi:hypothetical protein